MYESDDLARYTVGKCTADGHAVSNLHLQKMMYFLQYIYCKSTDGHLIFPDEFEAWPYGPVLRDVYNEYSNYGGQPIEERYNHVTLPPSNIEAFIDAGINILRSMSPWELVNKSHAPNSPWSITYRNGEGLASCIPNKLIIKSATAGV